MKILIVGSGGREQAIAWTLRKDPSVKKIFLAPGNAGSLLMNDVVENVAIHPTDVNKIVDFAKTSHINYAVIGPENALEKGIVNALAESGINTIGPTKEAAKIETSKAFAKSVMQSASIPTAPFKIFRSYEEASRYIAHLNVFPIVIKASGLAAGKGVMIAHSYQEALQILTLMFIDKIFGDASQEVIVEKFLEGQEMSIIVLTDGLSYKILPTAQDHKRIGENDTGKNTGGMGAYSPANMTSPSLIRKIETTIIEPLLEELLKRKTPYQGFLYAGLMIKDNMPYVIEFNARFGDPEAQVMLPLIETSFHDLLNATIAKKLERASISISNKSASTVVMASKGYPERYEIGKKISFSNNEPLHRYEGVKDDVMIFHAGTKQVGNNLVTSGGRILSVTSIASTLKESLSEVYKKITSIHFDGVYYRRDIGKRGLTCLD